MSWRNLSSRFLSGEENLVLSESCVCKCQEDQRPPQTVSLYTKAHGIETWNRSLGDMCVHQPVCCILSHRRWCPHHPLAPQTGCWAFIVLFSMPCHPFCMWFPHLSKYWLIYGEGNFFFSWWEVANLFELKRGTSSLFQTMWNCKAPWATQGSPGTGAE